MSSSSRPQLRLEDQSKRQSGWLDSFLATFVLYPLPPPPSLPFVLLDVSPLFFICFKAGSHPKLSQGDDLS